MKEKSKADLTKQPDKQGFKTRKNLGGETKEGDGVWE